MQHQVPLEGGGFKPIFFGKYFLIRYYFRKKHEKNRCFIYFSYLMRIDYNTTVIETV